MGGDELLESVVLRADGSIQCNNVSNTSILLRTDLLLQLTAFCNCLQCKIPKMNECTSEVNVLLISVLSYNF